MSMQVHKWLLSEMRIPEAAFRIKLILCNTPPVENLLLHTYYILVRERF